MVNSSDFIKEVKLGSGAFGVVWRVRAKKNNKLYAIKEQEISSPEALRQFDDNKEAMCKVLLCTPFLIKVVQNEVEVLRKMDPHRNVVAYYGCWREGNRALIVMEYASRGSLQDFMKRRGGPISEEDGIYLFSQIVLGVNHIHRESLIHRDLKPANVMLHRTFVNGQPIDIIKIGDFGISKDTGTSIAKTAIGTRIYMAPETVSGQSYGFKCDMWSSGIILYELLTHEFPFEARTLQEMMAKIRNGRVERITSGCITQGTLEMIYKLLSVNPDKRPRSTHLLCLSTIRKWNRLISMFLDDDRSVQASNGLISKPVMNNRQETCCSYHASMTTRYQ